MNRHGHDSINLFIFLGTMILRCATCKLECLPSECVKNQICENSSNLPQKGSSGSSNLSHEATSSSEETILCIGCEVSPPPATSYCRECMEWLCDLCVFAHRRVRLTRNHSILSKDSTPPGGTIRVTMVETEQNLSNTTGMSVQCFPSRDTTRGPEQYFSRIAPELDSSDDNEGASEQYIPFSDIMGAPEPFPPSVVVIGGATSNVTGGAGSSSDTAGGSSFSDAARASDQSSQSHCPKHRTELLQLFCEMCVQLTCRDCQQQNHKDHTYSTISEDSTESTPVERLSSKESMPVERLSSTESTPVERLSSMESSPVERLSSTLLVGNRENRRTCVKSAKVSCPFLNKFSNLMDVLGSGKTQHWLTEILDYNDIHCILTTSKTD